jgi:regulator of replication initiation timing
LKAHLPGCIHKKLSKAALLTRTVQQLEHMKKMQNELLDEVERLVKENSNLKKFAASATTTTTTRSL